MEIDADPPEEGDQRRPGGRFRLMPAGIALWEPLLVQPTGDGKNAFSFWQSAPAGPVRRTFSASLVGGLRITSVYPPVVDQTMTGEVKRSVTTPFSANSLMEGFGRRKTPEIPIRMNILRAPRAPERQTVMTEFDQHAINHMVVAINREMTPLGNKRHADADTMFMGGGYPTESEQSALGRFGFRKNWNIVFLSFDPANPTAGPIGIHTVVTDGRTQAHVLQRGRLWKKDRRSAAILLFPETRIAVRLNSKGRLVVGAMTSHYHDHGYDLALESVVALAKCKPGRVPVIGPIGSMVTVQDITTMQHALENAA